jgi:hypothetical protein
METFLDILSAAEVDTKFDETEQDGLEDGERRYPKLFRGEYLAEGVEGG